MNKKTLRHFSFLLAILMMLFSAPSIFAIEFGDVKGNWAEEYISWCSAKNIIKGYEDGTFKPARNITNAEFAVMLSRAIEATPVAIVDVNYTDVKPKDWFYAAVRNLVGFKILENVGEFKPNEFITRDTAFKWMGKVVSFDVKNDVISKFTDSNKVKNPNEFSKLIALDVVGGYEDNTLRPENLITRAEAAKLFYHFNKNIIDGNHLIDSLRDNSSTDNGKSKEEKETKKPVVPFRPHRPHKPIDDTPVVPTEPTVPSEPTVPTEPKKEKYKLSIEDSEDFTISVIPQSKDGMYEEGTVISFSIDLKNPALEIDKVLINGINISSVNDLYSFEMPGSNVSLKVVLKKKNVEKENDIKIEFENEDEEVNVKRNSKIIFDAITLDPAARDINLRLNRVSDDHLVYVNSYPIDRMSRARNLIDFVVPDFLEPGKYLISVKSGEEKSKIETKTIVVGEDFDKIVSVYPIDDVVITEGEDVVIPDYTKADYDNGSTRFVKIKWNLPESFNEPGIYEIEGKVAGYSEVLKIKVRVNKKRAKIESILSNNNIVITKGENIELPKFIKVKMSDGSIEDRTAHWDKYDFTSDDVGDHLVKGFIYAEEANEDSEKLPIKIKVTIREGAPFDAQFAIFKKPNYYVFQKDAMLGFGKVDGITGVPVKGDYALIIDLKNHDSKLEEVNIKSENNAADVTMRSAYLTGIYKRAFFIRVLSNDVKTKIVAEIKVDGEWYTKSVDFVAGRGFVKEAVAIEGDLVFKSPANEINLPDTLKVLFNDGSSGSSKVTWDTSKVDESTPGEYDIVGTLGNGLEVKAKLKITNNRNIKLDFSKMGTVTVKQSENIMPDEMLTLKVEGIAPEEVSEIEITSDNTKVVKIEEYDKNFDGSAFKIKAKAVGIGKAKIFCKLTAIDGQEATQSLNVVVTPIRDFKAEDFVVVSKDGGIKWQTPVSKIKVVSEKNQDLDLYAKVKNINLYSAVKVNSTEYKDAYASHNSIVGTKKKIAIYLDSNDTVPQAELEVPVIQEGQDYPWEKPTEEPEPEPSKFKIEDFTLTFEDTGWGGVYVFLSCDNSAAGEIEGFSINDSKGNNPLDNTIAEFETGGFMETAPDMNELYTLKVYGDKEGNTLLFEGRIKFSEGGR